MSLLIELFICFAKIGLFTFGGGYAMISFIEETCVTRKKWITHDEMMQLTVIAESTPGPVAINCATFVGYKQGGIKGALSATIGMIVPSFTVIFIISMFLDGFLENEIVAKGFAGIKIAVGLLIVNAAINMLKKTKMLLIQKGIFAVAFIVMLLINVLALDFSSIAIMLLAGTFSLFVYIIAGKREKKGGTDK